MAGMTRAAAPSATPSDPITLLPEAARRFTIVVESVPEAGWDNDSPCAGWTARDVLNHMTAEHLWAPHLLRGETLAQVGDRYDGDVLAGPAHTNYPNEPATWRARWARASADSLEAWSRVDRESRVHSSMGEQPVVEYAHQMLVDLTVHAWDLAMATGQDLALSPATVATAYAYEKDKQPPEGVPGLFDAPVPIAASAPLLHRLLALLGRDPARYARGAAQR